MEKQKEQQRNKTETTSRTKTIVYQEWHFMKMAKTPQLKVYVKTARTDFKKEK